MKSREIQAFVGLKHRESFQRNCLDYLLNEGLVQRTIPARPNSRLQQYRLTEKGSTMSAMAQ